MKAERAFEFVDIDDDTFGMSPTLTLRRLRQISSDVAGVLYVRPYGAMNDVSAFFLELRSEKADIVLIDDCCLAPPQTVQLKAQLVDLVLYSTGYAKYVDLGFGGYGFLRADLDEKLAKPENFERHDLDELTWDYKNAIQLGHEFRYQDSDWLDLSPLGMSVESYLSLVANAVIAATSHKRQLNEIYRSHLQSEIQLSQVFQWWRFNVLVPNKKELLDLLIKEGLFASSHYAALNGIFGPGEGVNAKRVQKNIVNFFNDFHFDGQRALRVAQLTYQHVRAYS